jgi:hypothetical protein
MSKTYIKEYPIFAAFLIFFFSSILIFVCIIMINSELIGIPNTKDEPTGHQQ